MQRTAEQILLITSDDELRSAAFAAAPAPDLLEHWPAVESATSDNATARIAKPRYAQVWLDLDSPFDGALPQAVRRVYFHSSATVELRGLAPGLFIKKPCSPSVWRMLWKGSSGNGNTVRFAAAKPASESGGVPEWLLAFQDLSLRKLCHKCVTRLPARLGFESASLYLHDADRGLLTLAETNHTRPVELAVNMESSNGALMTAVARAGEPLMTLDVHEVRRRKGIEASPTPTRPYDDASCLIAPLMCEGELRGVLNLSGRKPAAREIDLRSLERVLQFIARALHHAQAFERAQCDARIDGLTGLYNYRWLHESLEREIGRSKRHGEPLSIVMADLDGLKRVNDENGHAAGDFALREAARRILSAARHCDSAARVGGDEFIILLPETDIVGARLVAGRLLMAIREDQPTLRGKPLGMGISIGIAQWEAGMDARSLLDAADQAMYQAKRDGRNQIALASEVTTPSTPRVSRFLPSESMRINLDALRKRGQ